MEYVLGLCTGISIAFLFYHFHIVGHLKDLIGEIQSLRQKLNNKL